ncbi:MAG: FG-GAP repeat protein [Myxococcota bacterium]
MRPPVKTNSTIKTHCRPSDYFGTYVWHGPVHGRESIAGADRVLVGAFGYYLAELGDGGILSWYTGSDVGFFDATSDEPYLVFDGDTIYSGGLAAGDFNGDGADDGVIGGNYTPDYGAWGDVVLVDGTLAGERDSWYAFARIDPGDKAIFYTQPEVIDIGDGDADGHDDLLVLGTGAGAWLFRGPLRGSYSLDGADRAWVLGGRCAPRRAFGVGHANQDGTDDIGLALSCYETDYDSLAAVLVPGSGEGLLRPEIATATFVADLEASGVGALLGGFDVNGDGWTDVALQFSEDHEDPPSCRGLWVERGPLSGAHHFSDSRGGVTCVPGMIGELAAPDLDQDGLADLAVAYDPGSSQETGAVYLLYGSDFL